MSSTPTAEQRRDLAPPDFDHVLRTVSFKPARTDAEHSAGDGAAGAQFAEAAANAVTTEDEMLRLAGHQMDDDAVTSLLHAQPCSHQNGLRGKLSLRSAGFGERAVMDFIKSITIAASEST
jgi:hypothetical protein